MASSMGKIESEIITKTEHSIESKTAAESAITSGIPDPELNAFGQPYPKGVVLYACTFSLALANFLAALDIMIVTTLIDDVGQKFHAYSKTGWVVAGYSLPNAVLSLVWGRLASSVFGFKPSMIISIIIFEVGSIVCASAQSMNSLIGGRVIAGIGGSGIQSLTFVIASTIVTERQRGIIIAFMGASFGIASVVGPFLGGVFTTHVTWRWCFWINLPLGGLALVIFIVFYNPYERSDLNGLLSGVFSFSKISPIKLAWFLKLNNWYRLFDIMIFQFDIVEFILSSAGIVCLLLGFTFGGNRYNWNSYSTILLFIFGGGLIVLSLIYDFFIFPSFSKVKQNIQYQPLISWKNIKRRGIMTANVTVFFICLGYMTQIIYVVQYFQLIFNSSPWKASVHLIACVVPTVFTVIICGAINGRLGWVKPITLFGVTTGIIGAGLMTLLDNHATSAQKIGLLILPGVAFGATIQGTMIGAQIELDETSTTYRSDFVSITTLNSFLKNLGQAIGGVICEAVFSASILNKISDANIQIEENKPNSSESIVSYRSAHFDGPNSKLGDMLSDSIKNVFYMALGFYALGFIFGIFTTNKKVNLKKKISDNDA
ncbi:similar to Saccharomyces cerevisiae YGR224W AZR1 Plasma membrane transporter of the major facilitator superfamily [Maudiozyma saulgeensis]|uniref:Similar to Saccharomyces cerevisiae YGR224W AZR1 Plasma membrane transporter of the major facilitator superfamily n=1 Tax=Maudiozyma saulgeensis TaxID=1789683 RepID=A0A1X7QXC3_9SACH|nr:similar to Saccharomyces cerevisiae YGR224W AZR1 Plasma membrane transporter of the major facilitator superfamily [Kazachstania saulgeensis]